ncbi:hypothetical protein PUMCH_003672 [Australozyma saopauloensis]|uniref:DNA replication regulator Sld3 C-terminal domain-containing protein n=1 Tax=Australozyma saopauloensis TaxID=291208 RepID=A0AAX4HCN0_9ASCO|nr:hypothetical protein PUMCH_003672 [[Candida] saopauloensis]
MNKTLTTDEDVGSLEFVVGDGTDPLRTLLVTVVRPLPDAHLDTLQPSMFVGRKFLFLSEELCRKLDACSIYQVIVLRVSEQIRHGLLLSMSTLDRAFQLLDTQHSIVYTPLSRSGAGLGLDSSAIESGLGIQETILEQEGKGLRGHDRELSFLADTISETISSWGLSEAQTSSSPRTWNAPVISMKRPTATVPVLILPPRKTVQYNISPQTEHHPRDFLISRYFNTLYSLTTPLSYFPKTALNRLRNMCNNDKIKLLDALTSVLFSPEHLNIRHREKMGLAAFNNTTPTGLHILTFEKENQKIFFSRYYDDLSQELKFDNLVMDLKVREAQLQIIVLLEILLCSEILEAEFLELNSLKQEKANISHSKPSLVRRRKKQRIIPTLLGHGLQDSDTDSKKLHSGMEEFQYYKSLISLIDQLGIWGVFQGKGVLKNEDPIYGLLAYVLLPYYNKSLPLTVQFIVKSFKNLQPNFKLPKKSASRQNSSNDGVDSPALDHVSKRKTKFSKTLLSPDKLPFLRKTSSTIESSDLKPAILLKRSKSSLSSKNMHKRQVDMLGSKSDVNEETSEAAVKSQTLFLFCDARKVKSVPMDNSTTLEISQVEATPAKQNHNSRHQMSIESPEAPQVFATPSNVRVVDYRLDQNLEDLGQSITDALPRNTRRQTMLEKLRNVSDESSQLSLAVNKMPLSNVGSLLPNANDIIGSSPEKIYSSSPIKKLVNGDEYGAIKSSPIGIKSLDSVPTKPTCDDKPSSIAEQGTSQTDVEMQKPKLKRVAQRESRKGSRAAPQPALSTSFSNINVFNDSQSIGTEPETPISEKKSIVSEHSFKIQNSDSDLDSDFEKLMAAPRVTIKKYAKRR